MAFGQSWHELMSANTAPIKGIKEETSCLHEFRDLQAEDSKRCKRFNDSEILLFKSKQSAASKEKVFINSKDHLNKHVYLMH